MSKYRDAAIGLVAQLRSVWPAGTDETELSVDQQYEIGQIKDKLIHYIIDMGAPSRTVNKIIGTPAGSKDDPSSRRDLEYQDAIQQFWFGVVNGLSLVKARISPDDKIDINDPLEFLISKGKWAVLDMKRSANLKRLMQTCHVCDSTHKLFRPNISSLAFDETLCRKIRGDRDDDDYWEISEYRKRLLLEKIKRSPIKNPCKECYNEGVKDWYPIHGPAVLNSREFELDLESIDFMIFSLDTDVVELFMSSDPNSDSEDELNFIENSANNVFNEEIIDPYLDMDRVFDRVSIRDMIISDDDDPLYGYVYDAVYGGSMDACRICPKRAKLLVQRGRYTYDDIRRLTAHIMCGSDSTVHLGDWESEYKAAEGCGGIPMNDCDNINSRIANMNKIYTPKVREARKVIDNRYSAYVVVDDIIAEAIEDLAALNVRNVKNVVGSIDMQIADMTRKLEVLANTRMRISKRLDRDWTESNQHAEDLLTRRICILSNRLSKLRTGGV